LWFKVVLFDFFDHFFLLTFFNSLFILLKLLNDKACDYHNSSHVAMFVMVLDLAKVIVDVEVIMVVVDLLQPMLWLGITNSS